MLARLPAQTKHATNLCGIHMIHMPTCPRTSMAEHPYRSNTVVCVCVCVVMCACMNTYSVCVVLYYLVYYLNKSINFY